jgi:hypothetical protein
MNAEELLSEWESGEQTGMRPKRVQAVREDLMEHTDEFIPRRISEIEHLLDHPQQRGTITRALRDAVEGSDEDEDEE